MRHGVSREGRLASRLTAILAGRRTPRLRACIRAKVVWRQQSSRRLDGRRADGRQSASAGGHEVQDMLCMREAARGAGRADGKTVDEQVVSMSQTSPWQSDSVDGRSRLVRVVTSRSGRCATPGEPESKAGRQAGGRACASVDGRLGCN